MVWLLGVDLFGVKHLLFVSFCCSLYIIAAMPKSALVEASSMELQPLSASLYLSGGRPWPYQGR